MRLIEVKKEYGEHTALDGLSLEMKRGEITCVLGKSGAGKTTLLNILAGLCECAGELENLPKKVGYVFQENRLIPYMTVRQNLEFVGGRCEVIDQLLQTADMAHLAQRKAGKLSGGEGRRIALLRAFCVEADTVLLDEPFAALDTATKEKMMELTAKLIAEKVGTAVLVTHDLDEALRLADTIAVLDRGRIVYTLRLPQGKKPRAHEEGLAEREKLLSFLKEL